MESNSEENIEMKNILVVAAHPDDEVLGCGGTIAKHTKVGDEVHVVILTEGITSRDKQRNPKRRKLELQKLVESAQMANKVLGVSSLNLHNFPDNRMDSVDLLDIIKVIEGYINKHQPEIVYTHHSGDLNIDHKIVNMAVVTACRPIPLQSVKTILFFEVLSSTEWQMPASALPFAPNWFVDISETLAVKLQALAAYQSEMRPWPHARSSEAMEYLARWRGAGIGVEVAEAFVLGRKLIK